MGDEEGLERVRIPSGSSVRKLVRPRRKYFLRKDIGKRLGHPKDQLDCRMILGTAGREKWKRPSGLAEGGRVGRQKHPQLYRFY